MLKNKAFLFGFLLSLIFFLSLNIGDEFLALQRDHYTITLGFPFTFYYDMNPKELVKEKGFFFINFIADILIAIICSFIIGLMCKFGWSKISSRKSK